MRKLYQTLIIIGVAVIVAATALLMLSIIQQDNPEPQKWVAVFPISELGFTQLEKNNNNGTWFKDATLKIVDNIIYIDYNIIKTENVGNIYRLKLYKNKGKTIKITLDEKLVYSLLHDSRNIC